MMEARANPESAEGVCEGWRSLRTAIPTSREWLLFVGLHDDEMEMLISQVIVKGR